MDWDWDWVTLQTHVLGNFGDEIVDLISCSSINDIKLLEMMCL